MSLEHPWEGCKKGWGRLHTAVGKQGVWRGGEIAAPHLPHTCRFWGMTPGAEGSTDVTSWVYKNQQYQFPWQPCRRAGSEHHGPPSPQRCGKALGDSSWAKQCPHCCVALGKRMELGRGDAWSGATHPIPAAKPTAQSSLQGRAMLFSTGSPHFPTVHPRDKWFPGGFRAWGPCPRGLRWMEGRAAKPCGRRDQ